VKATIGDIAIDCTDPECTREFYSALTGWEKRTLWDCPALVADRGLVILFMDCALIPPVWPEEPGKQQKQMHLNLQVTDLPAAVKEALRLGATRPTTQYGGDEFVTLLDPEGHPFCLCQEQALEVEPRFDRLEEIVKAYVKEAGPISRTRLEQVYDDIAAAHQTAMEHQ